MNLPKEHQFEGVRYPIPARADADVHWVIFPELCKGCGLCIEKCPRDAIVWSSELGTYGTPRVALNPENCKSCGICATYCPDAAIGININIK